MIDRTRLEGLQVEASIGVYDFERQIKQMLIIDVVVHRDLRPAAADDDLARAVDYDRVAAACRMVAQGAHHRLIETVAQRIAERVMAEVPDAEAVDVRVAKPGAVPDAANVAVEINRTR